MNAHHSNFSQNMLARHLQEKIRRVEVAQRNDDGSVFSSGSSAIDQILPAQGYRRGTIVHWCSQSGGGAEFLSLLAARNAAQAGGAIVVIDPHHRFYPPAARAIGVELGNLIVLRGPDLLWAIEQSLRCSAVAAVWGELPEFATQSLATRWQRRFQLAAQASGCCGLFTKPQTTRHRFHAKAALSSSWAEVQWQLQPLGKGDGSGDTRLIRSTLVRCRGGAAGKAVDLEINTITGNVQAVQIDHAGKKFSTTDPLSLAAQLAHPAIGRRATRA